MVNLDIWLCVTVALLMFMSAGLALNHKNKYSRQLKILKVLPRIVVGIQFLIIPFLFDDIILLRHPQDYYTISDEIRAILWGMIILFASEVLIQFFNVRYGRAEIDK